MTHPRESSIDGWKVFHGDDLFECVDTIAEDEGTIRATAFAIQWVAPTRPRRIDVHYEALERRTNSGDWTSWAIGSGCADDGYQVRVIDHDNIWIEKR